VPRGMSGTLRPPARPALPRGEEGIGVLHSSEEDRRGRVMLVWRWCHGKGMMLLPSHLKPQSALVCSTPETSAGTGLDWEWESEGRRGDGPYGRYRGRRCTMRQRACYVVSSGAARECHAPSTTEV
jgi:hypothetical protein